jgi:hypothetical protein
MNWQFKWFDKMTDIINPEFFKEWSGIYENFTYKYF